MFDEGTGTSLADDKGGLTATATDTNWLDAYGNDPVPVNPLEEKYYFKKYKNPYDQVSADKVIGNRKRY